MKREARRRDFEKQAAEKYGGGTSNMAVDFQNIPKSQQVMQRNSINSYSKFQNSTAKNSNFQTMHTSPLSHNTNVPGTVPSSNNLNLNPRQQSPVFLQNRHASSNIGSAEDRFQDKQSAQQHMNIMYNIPKPPIPGQPSTITPRPVQPPPADPRALLPLPSTVTDVPSPLIPEERPKALLPEPTCVVQEPDSNLPDAASLFSNPDSLLPDPSASIPSSGLGKALLNVTTRSFSKPKALLPSPDSLLATPSALLPDPKKTLLPNPDCGPTEEELEKTRKQHELFKDILDEEDWNIISQPVTTVNSSPKEAKIKTEKDYQKVAADSTSGGTSADIVTPNGKFCCSSHNSAFC